MEGDAGVQVDVTVLRRYPGMSKQIKLKENWQELDFAGEVLEFVRPVQIEITVSSTEAGLLVAGSGTTSLRLHCSRCLEPFESEVDFLLDQQYSSRSQWQHLAIEQRDIVVPLDSDVLELNTLVQQQLILNLPMQLLCQADCRGLCSSCGQNLNSAICQCMVETEDSRWDSLAKFRSKMVEK